MAIPMLNSIFSSIKELRGVYGVYKFDQSTEIGNGTFGTVHTCIDSVSYSLCHTDSVSTILLTTRCKPFFSCLKVPAKAVKRIMRSKLQQRQTETGEMVILEFDILLVSR